MAKSAHAPQNEKAGGTIIPAHPGFVLLLCSLIGDEKDENFEPHVTRLPIVAWRIDSDIADELAVPIVFDEDDGDCKAILCPDGQVIAPLDQSWPDEAAWRKTAIEDATAHHERRLRQRRVRG